MKLESRHYYKNFFIVLKDGQAKKYTNASVYFYDEWVRISYYHSTDDWISRDKILFMRGNNEWH